MQTGKGWLLLILQKKRQLENARTIHESDRLFIELEALEWLQRQVISSIRRSRCNKELNFNSRYGAADMISL
ncbi:MAG: hypothetical protein ACREBU_10875 [Nitrososphaera sp.]